jgi:tetratricopeptide (TPR) repeat protein
MIVKNEAAHLARALESVRGLVDEVVLVDTGSTDGTIAVARAFGARLFEIAWQDDFSAARNYGIDRASGDWVLILDADESIAARDHAAIRALVDGDDADVVSVRQRNYVMTIPPDWQAGPGGYDEGVPYPGFVDVRQRRLFRRPVLRYRNRVHEHLFPVDAKATVRDRSADWVVHHYGKVGQSDRLRAKGEAYVRIGLLKAEASPDDPVVHYELGAQYSELGQHESALASFERVRTLAGDVRHTRLLIGVSLFHLHRYDEALVELVAAAKTIRGLAGPIALQEGLVHLALRDEPAAEAAFRRALEALPTLAGARVHLAALLERQGRSGEAAACLDRGVELSPVVCDLRLARARLRRTLGDEAGALADLERLDTDPAALRLRSRILARQRRFEEAQACLDRVADAADATLLSLRGTVALGLRRVDDAVALLRRSIDIEPTEEAQRNLATALKAQARLFKPIPGAPIGEGRDRSPVN